MSEKVAIVTGATRGIGLGITKQLLADGYKICVFGTRDIKDYEEFGDIYDPYNIFYFKGDISNINDRKEFISKAYEKFKSINILVNNAGVAPKVREDILEVSEESIDRLFEINTKAMFFLTQDVAKRMIKDKNKNKCIINISSISSSVVSVDRADYCISKAAISMITKLFASRLGEYGINVYEIQPGIIKTDMTKIAESKYDRLFNEGITPIRRWGYPEDIALAVSALAEFKFKYTTGQVIKVDGGYTLQTL
ncbi:MAG: 3-ketoacyl-ACP reductase [Anaerococcus prevotii]|uniref:3-ketoacyl-ACP reductase n=1 Tax=Anaerococcus prevotii TaxID=33034 RepID=UPI0028FFB22C|nr:3-ketoacyl-ACP reductase [Anaerococcus prevotii]MDU2557802.1 3-ketoacyl-ACP reductase [Anaerococcus prevotii]